MEIKEAIEHAREVAEGCPSDRDCAYQNDKLIDWLEELLSYRAIGTPEQLLQAIDGTLPSTCAGCAFEQFRPSEIHCQGCARIYADHYVPADNRAALKKGSVAR